MWKYNKYEINSDGLHSPISIHHTIQNSELNS